MTTPAATKPATRRPSRATRASAANAPKPVTKKPAAKPASKPAVAVKKPATPKGPSLRDQKSEAIQVLMDAAARIITEWNPARHHGIPADVARDAIRQSLGYVPDACWSFTTAHPVFGVRDVGRPAPKSKK